MNKYLKTGLYFIFIWLALISITSIIGKIFLERYGLEYALVFFFGGATLILEIICLFIAGAFASFFDEKFKEEIPSDYLRYAVITLLIMVGGSIPTFIALAKDSWGFLGIPLLAGGLIISPLVTSGIIIFFQKIFSKSEILKKIVQIIALIFITIYLAQVIISSISNQTQISSCNLPDFGNKTREQMNDQEIFYALNQAYEYESKTNSPIAMIGVTGEIDKRWSESNPSSEEINRYLLDPCLYDQTKLFIMKYLRNRLGGNNYSKEEGLQILNSMKLAGMNLKSLESRAQADSNYHSIDDWIKR